MRVSNDFSWPGTIRDWWVTGWVLLAGGWVGAQPASEPVPAPLNAGTETGGYVIDIGNREWVRAAYRSAYLASEGVPSGWTGSQATCTPGTTTAEFKASVVQRINYMRAMAGVPAWIAFSDVYNTKCQAAALILSGLGRIDHFPPPSAPCYSPEGAEAAARANIVVSAFGPEAVDIYIRDHGNNNEAVGHRRRLFYPNARTMGTGDVPLGAGGLPANAIWVFDDTAVVTRPATREPFVAWPPPGYVPYRFVWQRWSVSLPDANFQGASVQMTSNGIPVGTVVLPVAEGKADPTLVWALQGTDPLLYGTHERPNADVLYGVTVRNVRVGNVSRDVSYTVRVFDPDAPAPPAPAPVVTGPAQARVGEPVTFSLSTLPWAEGYSLQRQSILTTNFTEGAEVDLSRFEVATATGYEVRVTNYKASGNYAFRLGHPRPGDQVLTFRPEVVPGPGSTLSFASRLARGTSNQVARVQISENGGDNWTEVYTQPGNPAAPEGVFARRTVSLAAFAGKVVRIRFLFTLVSGSFTSTLIATSGWFLDDIEIAGGETYGATEIVELGAVPQGTLAWPTTGLHAVRGRARGFGNLPLAWGPAQRVSVLPSTTPTVAFRGPPARAGAGFRLEFTGSALPSGATFSLLRAPSHAGPWVRDGAAVLTILRPDAEYRFETPVGAAPSGFLRISSP